jgi:sulfite reductase (ferredoxin)
MSEAGKPSHVEDLKVGSRQLRGSIAEELSADANHFEADAVHLLKNHGLYQQDDRDERGQKAEDGTAKGKAYQFMVRTRIPGGKVTAAQFLAELDLCDQHGNGTVRITSRQGFQLHGVLKTGLKAVIRAINDSKLSTLAACGDVERNVMCCPAPIKNSPVRIEMQEMADKIAEHLKPKTTAYCEIWLTDENGEQQNVSEFQAVEEPIYGATYLPRKFKTAISLPEDNCVDIHSQDLGFLAIVEHDKIVGYNVLVGGGQGVTPSVKKTFPAAAKPLTFVTPDQVVGVAEAIVKVQRDNGNRSDRKIARMKYLIANWGIPAFKAKVEEYFGQPLPEPKPIEVTGVDDHLGWHEQGDGNWFLGVNVENGRIKDEGNLRIKSGLREILTKYGMNTRLTPLQSVILCDIAPEQKADINRILKEHGIKQADELSLIRRYSIACPAWPTCGLSITESERALPGILDLMEVELAKHGLLEEVIAVHMTGCPNGCARPYSPDIGLAGRKQGEQYMLYLGGNAISTRIGFMYADYLPKDDIIPTLSPLFAYFKAERKPGETFGDFCHRQGKEKLEAYAAAAKLEYESAV